MSEELNDDLDLKLAIIREKCEAEHLFFTRYFFKQRQGFKFIQNWHHHVLCAVIDHIIAGTAKKRNYVINVPPGSSKTEIVSINFIARGLAINHFAKFLHLSYSETLAALNSQTARDIITSDEFQQLWPLEICNDDRAKARWNVMVNDKKAGGVWATSLGGQVTGFRAGRMVEGFQGAIIIDDPLKPEDAFSDAKTNEANRSLITTVKSRKANPETPIVLIMQRLSEKDCTQFIKDGNLNDAGDWEFIEIPALIDEEYIQKNRHFITDKILDMIDGSEQDEKNRFSYWPYKEPVKSLNMMETGGAQTKEGNKISRVVFAGQYMQKPVALGGNIIRGEWFFRYKTLPQLRARYVFADTAQKVKQHNDFSVFECWGEGVDGRIYLLDLIKGKWEAPELKRRAREFWNKHKNVNWEGQFLGQLRKMYVEDKASGTGLIQEIKNDRTSPIPVEGIERNTDKLTRVMDGTPYLEMNLVGVPEEAPFVSDFIRECEAFTPDDTHAHDDQVDPMLDAIDKLLSNKNKLKQWENIV